MQADWVPLNNITKTKVDDLSPGDLVMTSRPSVHGRGNIELRVDYQAPVGLRKCLMTLRHETLPPCTFLRLDDGYAWSETYHLALSVRIDIDVSQSRPPQAFSPDALGQVAIMRDGAIRIIAGQFVSANRRNPILVDPASWTVDVKGSDIEAHYPAWRVVASLPDERFLEIAFPPEAT